MSRPWCWAKQNGCGLLREAQIDGDPRPQRAKTIFRIDALDEMHLVRHLICLGVGASFGDIPGLLVRAWLDFTSIARSRRELMQAICPRATRSSTALTWSCRDAKHPLLLTRRTLLLTPLTCQMDPWQCSWPRADGA